MTNKLSSDIIFNNTVIPYSQIFLMRKNVFGLINNRPFVKGHVLVCSKRCIPKLQNLTEIETLDLFMTAQEVAKKLQTIYNVQYEMTVQNGKDAGQTVNQVHIHLCPRHAEHALERKNQEVRLEDDMAKEAEKYRGLFEQSAE